MVWGGRRLESLGRRLPFDHTGESWDITCRADAMGVIRNGACKGMPFIDYINSNRQKILGTRTASTGDFPLLVKIIYAEDNLSVQVHPDDEYALRADNELCGKNEMWYVLEAPPDSYLIIGLRDGVGRERFKQTLERGVGVEDCLNKLHVRRGDVIDIPAGLVHAVGKGIMLAEIQQNSDLTYRIYDYNRAGLDGKPRLLHTDKALDVIDFDYRIPREAVRGVVEKRDGCTITRYICNPYFDVCKYDISMAYGETSDPSNFYIYTCVNGTAEIYYGDMATTVCYGDSVFIPADMGVYTIKGPCELLKCFVP